MWRMKTVDHDPNEPQRQQWWQPWFELIFTVAMLGALGVALAWAARSMTPIAFFVACVCFTGTLFLLALRIEARKKRYRASQRRKLGLRSDQ